MGQFCNSLRARPRPRHFVWAILIWLDGHPYQAHWDLNISVLHMFRMFYPWERILPKTIATHSESVVTNASPFTSGRSLFLLVLSWPVLLLFRTWPANQSQCFQTLISLSTPYLAQLTPNQQKLWHFGIGCNMLGRIHLGKSIAPFASSRERHFRPNAGSREGDWSCW